MKTTVNSTNGGSISAERLGPRHIEIYQRVPGLPAMVTYHDKHSAYVLGNALIHLAQTIEAEEGGYELCNKVSSGVACTSRKGTRCPDCGPCLVDYAGRSAEDRQ